jgi:Na+/H+ antiporter NhaD/arsenite permease-like protein
MDSFPILSYAAIGLGFFGIAVGRLPKLAMNRTTIALVAAIALVQTGGMGYKDAFAAIDVETLALLLAMMILVANLRLSGFFSLASAKLLSHAKSPRAFLALVIVASGFLSALFINDTICIMLTPFVIEIAKRTGRNGLPYLVGLATSANAGSCATAIGNPQNMLIASQSGIPFLTFFVKLAVPAGAAMILCYIFCILVFRKEFSARAFPPVSHGSANEGGPLDRMLLVKSLFAAGFLLVALGFGMRTSSAALLASALMLCTRRIDPQKVLAQVDFSLLVFFSSLFVLTSGVARSPLFQGLLNQIVPTLDTPGIGFSASILAISNLVSNVPAVMLLSPVAQGFPDSQTAWLVLAMASTFAGNLTLLGSVANLIVAEQGEKAGIRMGFSDYLKVGLPVTFISIAFGTFWLGMVN